MRTEKNEVDEKQINAEAELGRSVAKLRARIH